MSITVSVGEIVKIAGIYKCNNPRCHGVERTFPLRHKVPPCGVCGHTTYTLVRKTHL